VLHARPGSSFATRPRYVAGVQTKRGLVLLWAARRKDGANCTGVQAAFGDPDVVRLELAGRAISDNGITCGPARVPLGSSNAGLTTGQGLGSVHVMYGQVPARVRAVRVTFEDGRTQTAPAARGWVMVAFEQDTRRPGHRPILEQALDADEHPLATERLNPWDFGGTPPPPPALDGPGSTLLATVPTPAGPATLRLSAAGSGWRRQQCWGLLLGRRSTPILCAYPGEHDPGVPPPATTNLFLYGPSVPGLVIAVATRIDSAWLVAADYSVRRARPLRFLLAGRPQIVIAAATRSGPRALAGIVTSREHRIAGALLMAARDSLPEGAATPPCFLTDNGHAPTTGACQAIIAAARPPATAS
jgi:hypothetical protein